MAEETEKKPEFVVHKKQQDNAPAAKAASPEKKKVVVVKKKPVPVQNQNAPKPAAEAPKKDSHVVVKKAEEGKQNSSNEQKTPAKQEQNQNGSFNRNEGRRQTFELNPSRPNVKAGNLSDKPRQGGYNRNNQYGNNGYNRNNQGGNRPFNREGGSGFTGAQARQGYQNRERDNNGQNRQGGFQNRQGGFQNRQGGGQGGGFRPPRAGGMGARRFRSTMPLYMHSASGTTLWAQDSRCTTIANSATVTARSRWVPHSATS